MTLSIVEVIRKLVQGRTNPYLCRAENDQLYVVKGRQALIAGCAKEVICASLGRSFGLPIPEFEILFLPEELMALDQTLVKDLGEQSLFGSSFQPQLEEVNHTILAQLDPELLCDLFVFDYWVKNEDRTYTQKGGNPNLFYQRATKRAVVADHNLAFDADFSVGQFKQLHLGASAWFGQEMIEASINYYTEKMSQVVEMFDDCCDNLPPDWIEKLAETPGWQASFRAQLFEFKEEPFWEPLRCK